MNRLIIIFLFSITLDSYSQETKFNYLDTGFQIGSKKTVYSFGWRMNGLARLHPDKGESNMDSLINFLDKNKHLKIQIDIHSDLRGEEEFNKKVTDRRVDAFKNFYFKDKIDLNRVIFYSHGESKPEIALSEIEKIKDKKLRSEAHWRNNRIIITILDTSFTSH
jgi:hypothetical protein